MSKRLEDKRVAVLATHGFELSELLEPRLALGKEGAHVEIVSPETVSIRSWRHSDWGNEVDVDVPLREADADDYDALFLPGGVMNPDSLRRDPEVLGFVRAFFEAGKPVGAICHGAWTLIDAGVVEGRRMTSYHSIQTDLKNAGAQWEDAPVVVDRGLVTSRRPDDLQAFIAKLVEEIQEGIHEEQASRTVAERGAL